MEASYVIWRLPPYLSGRSKRLIKSPKIYVGDAGLAAYLMGVPNLDAHAVEPYRGALLETYVAVNLAGILAAHWLDARLHFWNVPGQYEIDFVIEVGRDCLAIEVKAGTRWGGHDLAPLHAFLAATPRCRAAILAYNGTQVLPLGDRLWAVPLGLVLS